MAQAAMKAYPGYDNATCRGKHPAHFVHGPALSYMEKAKHGEPFPTTLSE